MKKKSAETKNEFVGLNSVIFKGKVRSVKGDKVKTVHLSIPYERDGKSFTTSSFIKVFDSCTIINCKLEDLEEKDILQVECHQVTRKYNDKYYNEMVADVVEYCED